MDFDKLARARSSQRAYDPDRPIDAAVLRNILETALVAPSAANRQPWHIVVVQSQERLDRVHAAYTRDWFLQAPCVLVVKGRRDQAWVRNGDGYNALETDLTILMDHLTLAATDCGLGTCWIAAFDPEVLRSAISLDEGETVFAITPLGYAPTNYRGPMPKTRKSFDETVSYI